MKIESHSYCAGHGDYREHDVITWDSREEETAFKFALKIGVVQDLILYWMQELQHPPTVKNVR